MVRPHFSCSNTSFDQAAWLRPIRRNRIGHCYCRLIATNVPLVLEIYSTPLDEIDKSPPKG